MFKTLNVAFILTFITLLNVPVFAADRATAFGRFFTTPEQRLRLNEIREKSGMEVSFDVTEFDVKEEKNTEENKLNNTILLKGYVHRANNKNTAWLNDTNSFEGDMATQSLVISNDLIDKTGVRINLPNTNTSVQLKTGQSFDPVEQSITDLMKGSNKNIKSANSPSTVDQE